MNKELTDKVLQEAMKREDRRAIPLIIEIGELSKYYSTEYIIEKMQENYDGRQTYFEKNRNELDNWRDNYKFLLGDKNE